MYLYSAFIQCCIGLFLLHKNRIVSPQNKLTNDFHVYKIKMCLNVYEKSVFELLSFCLNNRLCGMDLCHFIYPSPENDCAFQRQCSWYYPHCPYIIWITMLYTYNAKRNYIAYYSHSQVMLDNFFYLFFFTLWDAPEISEKS